MRDWMTIEESWEAFPERFAPSRVTGFGPLEREPSARTVMVTVQARDLDGSGVTAAACAAGEVSA